MLSISMRKKIYPFLCLCIVAFPFSQVLGVAYTWNNAAGGDWNLAGNWLPAAVPNAAVDTATFGAIIAAPQTITLNSSFSPTVNAMTFANANAYTIGTLGQGPIHLVITGATDPTIVLTSGSHNIVASLDLANPLTISGVGALSISGVMSGSSSLTMAGTGTVTLSGANSYSGGTNVSSGTLIGNTTSLQGAITVSGGATVLNFTQTTTGTYTGSLQGASGNVNFSSSGAVLTVTGANTFSGITNLVGTTILNIGGASSLPSGTVNMAAGSTLQSGIAFTSTSANPITLASGTATFDSLGFTMTLSRPITGVGPFVKVGSGTVILNGVNTYSGGTTVSGGILQGTATSLQGNISIASGASLVFNQTGVGTYAGNLSGSGSLTVQGGSTLTMSGNNNPSFTGTTTVNNSTTLELASGSALGSGTLALSSGTLKSGFANLVIPNIITFTGTGNAFDSNGNTMTLSGLLQGSGGGFTKTGTGTVIITGTANTYSGGTTVNGGSLQGTASTLKGAFTLTSPGQLVFNQTTIGTSAITVSGNGSLNVQGGSTLTMTGNSSTFTGATSVLGSSTLVVDGNLQGSPVSVAAGSILSGSGTVGATTINGQLAPGTAGNGTLFVSGALTFNGTPSFLVALTPTTNGKVQSSGIATLTGDVIASANIGSSFFGISQTYTILTASSLVGTFNPTVIVTNPAFTGSLSYTATDVFLQMMIQKPFLHFPFENTNERSVGNNIDAINSAGTISSDMVSVIDALTGQSDAAVNQALNQMHPANMSAFAEAQGQLGGQLLSLFHRFPSLVCGCDRPNRLWVEPFGNWLKVEDRGIQLGFWTNTGGIAFGYDRRFFDCWTLGVGGAWNSSNLKWFKGRGHAHMSGLYGSLYSDLSLGRFYFGSSLYAGKDWYNTTRHIHFTTIDRRARSTSSGIDAAGQVTGAYFFGMPSCLLYPYATLDCLYLHNDSFREKGADSLNLHVDTYKSTTLRLETGAGWQWIDKNASGTFCISPLISMGYVWEKPYRDHYHSTFQGQTLSFKTLGWHRAWNLLNLRFGIKMTYRCFFLDSQYIGDVSIDKHYLLNQRANFRLGVHF